MRCTPYTSRHSSRYVCRLVDLIPKREVLAIDYGISLEEVAKGRAARALEKSGWNQSKAAERLASAEQFFGALCLLSSSPACGKWLEYVFARCPWVGAKVGPLSSVHRKPGSAFH